MKTMLRASRLVMTMVLLAGIAAASMSAPRPASAAGGPTLGFNY